MGEPEVFNKVFSYTDATKEFTIPTKHLGAFEIPEGQRRRRIEIVSTKLGGVWPCECRIRENGHPKPVISSGWKNFIQAKRFKKGDRVIFYRMENGGEALRFRVQGQRKWGVLGRYHWLDIEQFRT